MWQGVAVSRTAVTSGQLAGVARAALGGQRSITDVVRLRDGSKKGVYRLTLDDDSTVIVYIWDAAENYWPSSQAEHADDQTNPFSHASGLELFLAAQARLDTLGVRTPLLHLADSSGGLFPANIAVVEDVAGESLETLLHRSPPRAQVAMARLAGALDVMQSHRGRPSASSP